MNELIRNIRLHNQQLVSQDFKKPEALVSHFGAMQAQDFAMAKWAVGLRSGNSEQKIDKALDEGKILRTHLLRPTWHFVAADDIHWILELTSPQIKTILRSSAKQFGVEQEKLTKSCKLLENLLRDDTSLSRDEIVSELNKNNIATDNYHSSHILMHAEMEGLICSGKSIGSKTTYALLEERVPKPLAGFSKDEALSRLAKVYFTSHGPATLQDFTWWSGLSATNSRLALESIKSEMEEIKSAETVHYFYAPAKRKKSIVALLPAFDEFLISYKDRNASIDLQYHPKAFTRNGIFNPVLMIDGKIEGAWKRTVKKENVVLQIDSFAGTDFGLTKEIQSAAELFGKFLGKNVEII